LPCLSGQDRNGGHIKRYEECAKVEDGLARHGDRVAQTSAAGEHSDGERYEPTEFC